MSNEHSVYPDGYIMGSYLWFCQDKDQFDRCISGYILPREKTICPDVVLPDVEEICSLLGIQSDTERQ